MILDSSDWGLGDDLAELTSAGVFGRGDITLVVGGEVVTIIEVGLRKWLGSRLQHESQPGPQFRALQNPFLGSHVWPRGHMYAPSTQRCNAKLIYVGEFHVQFSKDL